jgi:uncharacterized delta-60 repeat protein
VTIDADGAIVVTGCSYQVATGWDFALARYSAADGSLDTGFGDVGKVTTDFGSYEDVAQGVAIDANGRIVLAGYSHQGVASYDFALARYLVGLDVGQITAPVDPVEAGTFITASATFTDVYEHETHTAVWDWGDGTTSAGTVAETVGMGTVTGGHAYDAAGVYTVMLTVTVNATGDSDQSLFQYVVVFDPGAGFVTGSGWIDSPTGAYVPDETLTGRAKFGFVSKYEEGANVPTGQTQFHFRLADLNFRSTNYQWLVVAGAKAQFKGTGTINREGNYGFMITATDGQIDGGGGEDKFRIKIWDKDTDAMVYDNQLGADQDSDPTTLLERGSIVIHDGGDALHAAEAASVNMVGAMLSKSALTPAVEQAISYWSGQGVGADSQAGLSGIEVRMADLPGSVLGIASSSNLIWIDRDAAGYGWRVDSIDMAGSTAGGMDLLSVLTHEMGHKFGLEHSGDHGVMAATLAPGVRTMTEWPSSVDCLFALESVYLHNYDSGPSIQTWLPSLPRDTLSFGHMRGQRVSLERSWAVGPDGLSESQRTEGNNGNSEDEAEEYSEALDLLQILALAR